MSSPLLVILDPSGRDTHGLLAREALRQAAQAAQVPLRVEAHTRAGVQDPLSDAELASAAAVLYVGENAAQDARLASRAAVHSATLDAVLHDAASVLQQATSKTIAQNPIETSANALKDHKPQGVLRIVAITSCPTGIAHTFMAEEGLKTAAAALGHQIKVETQGSVGAQNALTPQDIADADLVIIAADTQVDTSRFAGKRLFSSSTKAAIKDGQALIAQAQQQASVHGAASQATAAATSSTAKKERTGLYKHLMTGVSFMLPFVVTGGLLIALGFALGGIYVYEDQHKGTLGWTLFTVGKQAFSLMIPVLSGYIAYSIADRPGITPGMAGGVVADAIGAGFLGGLVSGFVAGYSAKWLNEKIQLGRNLDGLKPVLILPLLSTAIVGLLMYFVIGQPVASVLAALTEWLKGMQTGSALALGLLLGGMMAIDMGGPINKAAYTFGTGLIASEVYAPMAAVMAGGMTPPLAIAVAAWLFKSRFTAEERDGAKAAGVMGLAFITEGAIPFAAKDPLRVIPALAAGSALTGAISMLAGCQLRVPHGGAFVLPIPNAVTNLGMYLVAIAAGTALSVVLLGILKKPVSAVQANAA
ncbi:MAG: fructose-specific PTS transporter subunit EIIC [Pseudomonadota bacterium]|nr:fructose-specific PTS transporter subunit EIIC [Pseudomonadota bacterium]